jgi:hypothetical protein
MLIEGGNVYDEETDTTKTSKARVVLLSAPAFDALQRQRAATFLQGEHVFHGPKTERGFEPPICYEPTAEGSSGGADGIAFL